MKKVFLLISVAFFVRHGFSQSPHSRDHYLEEVSFYSQKINQEPDDITSYFLRGTFYQVLSNFQVSNADFKKVLELYTRNPSPKYEKVATDACYFLADDYYFRRADRTSAQSYINWGLSITPDDKRFEVLQTGILGTYPDREEEARRKFESLISKYPKDEKLIQYYAKFMERKDMEKAMQLYEQVVAMNPYNIDALFALGSYYTNESSSVYTKTGDALKAMKLGKQGISYFERVHQLNPDDREIMEILVQSYGNMNMDTERKKMEQELAR